MPRFLAIVYRVMEVAESVSRKGSGKSRTRAEKVGRLKYMLQLLKRLDRKISRLDQRQRTIFQGLKEFMSFDKDYLLNIVCQDTLDGAILQALREGDYLPSSLSSTLETRGLKGVNRFKVTRRIQGMNKRLQRELGQNVAEKRGKAWSLTRFMYDVWGATVEEAREELPTGEET